MRQPASTAAAAASRQTAAPGDGTPATRRRAAPGIYLASAGSSADGWRLVALRTAASKPSPFEADKARKGREDMSAGPQARARALPIIQRSL